MQFLGKFVGKISLALTFYSLLQGQAENLDFCKNIF